MIQTHGQLALRAAEVAASAIRTIESVRTVLGPPNGEVSGFSTALALLRGLYAPPAQPVTKPKRQSPKRARAIVRRAEPKPEPVSAPVPAEAPEQESAWDPEPFYEARHCQALLLEIIRRAAHDWVLYRQHERPAMKQLAQNAYTWLFEEEPGHPAWRARESSVFRIQTEDGQEILEVGSRRLTSFHSICEACGLDPEAVRDRAREMTVESIMHTGRHIERRRPSSESVSIESYCVAVDVDVDALEVSEEQGAADYQERYESRDGYSDYL